MRLGQKNRVPRISVQMEAAGWVAASLNSTWASQQVPGWAWTNNEQRILNKPNSILGYITRRTMARRSREVISSYLCWWVIPLSHADSPLVSVAMFCVLGKWVKKNWTVRYDDGPCLFPETAPLQVRLAIRSAQSHVHQYYSYSFTAYLAHYSIKNRQCWSNSELCILYLHICLLHLTQPGRRCAHYRV